VGLVRADVSEVCVSATFGEERTRKLGTLAATSILSNLKTEATRSSETSALSRPKLCHIPDDDILNNIVLVAVLCPKHI
jgi:hypothetical protein